MIKDIENVTEGQAVEILRRWSTERLQRALAAQVQRDHKGMEFKDVDSWSRASHCAACIERVLEERTAQ